MSKKLQDYIHPFSFDYLTKSVIAFLTSACWPWFYLSDTCSPGWSRAYSRRAVKRLCVCVWWPSLKFKWLPTCIFITVALYWKCQPWSRSFQPCNFPAWDTLLPNIATMFEDDMVIWMSVVVHFMLGSTTDDLDYY